MLENKFVFMLLSLKNKRNNYNFVIYQGAFCDNSGCLGLLISRDAWKSKVSTEFNCTCKKLKRSHSIFTNHFLHPHIKSKSASE